MKIEFRKQEYAFVWEAYLDERAIGWIDVKNTFADEVPVCMAHTYACGEHTNSPIPGSPFASVNQAKAAMEYHFRNLTETA